MKDGVLKWGDSGPSVGHPSQTPPEENQPQESEETVQPGRSPLMSELLASDEELTEVLDYEDVEESDLGVPDPEIAQAVAHIPQADTFADVEMQESQPPLGFEPEVSRSGYDVNLVRSGYGDGKPDVGRSDFQNPWSRLAGQQRRPRLY